MFNISANFKDTKKVVHILEYVIYQLSIIYDATVIGQILIVDRQDFVLEWLKVVHLRNLCPEGRGFESH